MKEENNNKELIKGIIMFLLFFILPLLLQLIFYNYIKNGSNIVKSIILLIIEIINFLIFVFMYKNEFKNKFKDLKKNFSKDIDIMIKYYILGIIIMIVTNLIINIFILKGIASNESANRTLISVLPIYAIPTIVFFGPIVEEIAFRLTFKNVIKKEIPYVIITTLLFAAAHVFNSASNISDILYIIPYASIGAALGIICYKTDNPLCNIIVHILHNTLTLLLLILI